MPSTSAPNTCSSASCMIATVSLRASWSSSAWISPRSHRQAGGLTERVRTGAGAGKRRRQRPRREGKASLLSTYGRDLTQLARVGRTDPLVGRGQELRRLAQVLLRRTKNNPVLVGDAGVGKTAIVEGWPVASPPRKRPPLSTGCGLSSSIWPARSPERSIAAISRSGSRACWPRSSRPGTSLSSLTSYTCS